MATSRPVADILAELRAASDRADRAEAQVDRVRGVISFLRSPDPDSSSERAELKDACAELLELALDEGVVIGWEQP